MTDELAQAVESGKFTQKTADKLDRLAPGSFCSHKSWGFGRVAEWNLIAGQILIDFGPRKNHPMQADYAAETLVAIPAEHILAQRETDPAGLKERCSSDPLGVARQILSDHGGKATADLFASILSPAVLDTAGFKRWWDAARKKMKADGHFKLPTKKTDPYVLLEAPVNAGEGFVHTFKEARHTKDQLLALDQISKSLDDLAGQEEALQQTLDRIHEISQKLRRMSPAAAIEMLAVRDEILQRFPNLAKPEDAQSIADILSAESSKLSEIFSNLPGARQRDVLDHFEAAFGDSWPDRALRLLREAGARLIADVCRLFEKHGRKDDFQSTLERWISDRSITSEMLIWLCKERDKRFPDLFNAELLAAVFSALEADMLAEKRTSRLKDLLMDDRELVGDLLVSASRDVVRDSMRKLMLTPVFDDLSKRSLMARIVKLYPETQNMITGAHADEGDTSLTVSWPSLEKRKAEFDHLVAKEIPQNLRDINIAKEQGDLRENAGFKAAKDHQRVLQSRRVEMERDLARARGTEFENPNTAQVSIGTVVTVRHEDGSAETFTILGAWDSAPDHGIVSYKAGIGQALLGSAQGATVELPAETGGARKATVESIRSFTDFELLKKLHTFVEPPASALAVE
jgi:transcription elongation GreA/GreB family factor